MSVIRSGRRENRSRALPRTFRLVGKKRGARRTGSPVAAGVGEGFFYGVVALAGSAGLGLLIVWELLPKAWFPPLEGWVFWLLLVVLLALVVIGATGVFLTVLEVGASAERRAALRQRASQFELISASQVSAQDYPGVPRGLDLINSPGVTLKYRLPPAFSPAWGLVLATILGLVWNGVGLVLMGLAVVSHRAGQPEWFLTLFGIAFAGLGVWGMYYFLRELRAATGIGPTSMEISELPLRPGKRYEIWLLQRGRHAIRSLEVSLVCEEEAIFHQGTNVRAERREVRRQKVLRCENVQIGPDTPLEQRGVLAAPADAMHSFQSPHNAVRWKLVVEGEAEGWPPFERCFPILVYPDASEGN
jgi:hypothetical protein